MGSKVETIQSSLQTLKDGTTIQNYLQTRQGLKFLTEDLESCKDTIPQETYHSIKDGIDNLELNTRRLSGIKKAVVIVGLPSIDGAPLEPASPSQSLTLVYPGKGQPGADAQDRGSLVSVESDGKTAPFADLPQVTTDAKVNSCFCTIF